MARTLLTTPRRWLFILGTAAAVFAALVVIGEHGLMGVLLRELAARSGRQVRIEGPLEVQLLSLHPRLKAQKVSISNPTWMPAGVMADIGSVSIVLRWRLSLPPFEVERLEVHEARLRLLRERSGRANWHLHESGPGRGPPLIGSLSMPDADVELHDERHHVEFRGRVSAGDADDGIAAPPPLRIAGAGELNGRPATFAITGQPLAQARRDQPYHFTVVERANGNRLEARGFLEHPFDFRALQGTFAISGPDLKDAYYLIGLRMPDTGPYEMSGRFLRHNRRFECRNFLLTSGQSDVGGNLSVDSSGSRPKIVGELTARTLRSVDVGARAAGRAPEEENAAGLRVPTTPLRTSGLQNTDWNVKLEALRLELGPERFEHLTATLSIDHAC